MKDQLEQERIYRGEQVNTYSNGWPCFVGISHL